MSKLIDYIVDEVRESTENEEFDQTVGITEEEIIRFINDAQNRLHAKIVAKHPQVFVAEDEQNIVADQETYSLSHKAFLSNKVSQVEYSPTTSQNDYYPLRPASLYNRDTGGQGDPDRYIRRSNQILLIPTPASAGGKLRISFVRKLPRLDKRRGQIKAVTTSGSQITNLEVNYINGAVVDNKELLKRTKFSVVDKYGNIKMENVLLSSIDTSVSYDATITVDSSFSFESGETITVDDYIVPGDYATTHLELGFEIERYIQSYCEYKVLKRDSSIDSQEALQELSLMEQEIIDSYAEISDDIVEIPEINDEGEWL